MDLVVSAYKNSGDSDSDSDFDSVGQEEEAHTYSLPDVPQEVLYKYQKSPIINPHNKTMYKTPFDKRACYIFLEFRLTSRQQQVMDGVLNDVNSVMTSFNNSHFQPLHRGKVGTPKPLHISLSPNMCYETEEDLKLNIEQMKNRINMLQLKSLPIRFSGDWKLFENFDSSIWFLALSCDYRTKKALVPILDIIHKFGPTLGNQPEIYEDNLHISLGTLSNDMLILDGDKTHSRERLQMKQNILSSYAISKLPLLRTELQFRCSEIRIQCDSKSLVLPL